MKRILCLLISALLLLSALPANGFAAEAGGRYIVRFSSDISPEELQSAVTELNCSLITESDRRLFSLVLNNPDDFESRYGEITEYLEPDLPRSICALTDDPLVGELDELISSGFISAWDRVTGSKDIIVAVLDTGIDRTHEELSGANILTGYDAVARKSGVYDDPNGHGTKICGIIAAVANNSRGTAGAAHGVTLLPIRVTDGEHIIYSSDLVAAIHFAADSGAAVINMSFGGYSRSYAEEEAIAYALRKGCIPVASAGNDGLTLYGGRSTYPASYDGVISVGSLDAEGQVSVFSQHNAEVDICAPGEKLCVLRSGGYGTDSGSSLSAALVSSAAALAVASAGPDVRLGHDEFMSLIHTVCGTERDDYTGFGALNAAGIATAAALPIVSGVYDGGVYYNAVTLRFNRGEAELDGEPIRDGETVIENGRHTLTITDQDFFGELTFTLNNAELTYNYLEYGDRAEFVFTNGEGWLDGFPYNSGDAITISGAHIFVLRDPSGHTVTRRITPEFTLPAIYGVSDNAIYQHPVMLDLGDTDSILLDGEPKSGRVFVGKEGMHTLISSGGESEETVTFTIDLSGIVEYPDFTDEFVIHAESNMLAAFCRGERAVYIYDRADLSNPVRTISTGVIENCHIAGELLVVVCEDKVTAFSAAALLSEAALPLFELETEAEPTCSAVVGDRLFITAQTSLLSLDLLQPEAFESLSELELIPNAICVCGDRLCLSDAQGGGDFVLLYGISDGSVLRLNLPSPLTESPPILCDDGLVIDGMLLSAENGLVLFDAAFGAPLAVTNSYCISADGVFSLSDGSAAAIFDEECLSAAIYGDTLCLRRESGLTVIPDFERRCFGGCPPLFAELGESEYHSPYSEALRLSMAPCDISAVGNKLFTIFEGENRLYISDFDSEITTTSLALRFQPKTLKYSDGRLLISFANRRVFAVMSEDGAIEYHETDFVPERLFAHGDYVFTLSERTLRRISLVDGSSDDGLFSGSLLTAYGKRLFLASGRFITAIDADTMELLYVARAASEVTDICAYGDYLAGGGRLFAAENGSPLLALSAEPIMFFGDLLLTVDGIISCDTLVRLSEWNFDCDLSAPGSNRHFSLNGRRLVITDMTTLLESHPVTGITDGESFSGSAVPTYALGIGYVDGVRTESGTAVTDGGEHEFALCLPCGITNRIRFTVIPAFAGINVVNHTRIIEAGDTTVLHVNFLPVGASSVPLRYTPDSDIVAVSDSGVVTALSDGITRIEISTLDGLYKDYCLIKVTQDLIRFTDEALFSIDRENGMLNNIPLGTAVRELLALSPVPDRITVASADGEAKTSGLLATGDTVTLSDFEGNPLETLVASVTGDPDGDGYATVGDLEVIIGILKNKQSYPLRVISAADLDKSGVVTNHDMSMMSSQLLNHHRFSERTPDPEYSESTSAFLLVQKVATVGNGLLAAVVIESPGNISAVSGRVNFNGDVLGFSELVGTDMICDIYKNRNSVSFTARYDGKNTATGYVFPILLRFDVAEDAAECILEFELDECVILCDGNAFSLYETAAACECEKPNAPEGLEISVFNSFESFEFNPDIREYKLSIPRSAAFADLSVSYPQGGLAVVSDTVLADAETLDVTVSYSAPDGSSADYVFHFIKAEAPLPDPNCRLAELAFGNLTLSPEFSPEILSYTLTIEYDEALPTPSYRCESVTASAEHKSNGDSIFVTCTAEDGSVSVTEIKIVRKPAPIESTDLSDDVSQPADDGALPFIPVAIIIVCLAIAAVILLLVRRRNH